MANENEDRTQEQHEREELPRRNPGAHWTGPSGEHVEVPVTPRTLTNIRNWGRVIQ